VSSIKGAAVGVYLIIPSLGSTNMFIDLCYYSVVLL